MANVKISALPAATLPLAGTEEIPLVQSTATKKVTVDSINANATLQQVTAGTNKDFTNDRNLQGTDAGNGNTGDSVNAFGNGALQNNTGDDVNAFGTDCGIGNSYDSVNLFGYNATADDKNQSVFANYDGANTLNARLSYITISDDRKYELPDASGTLVLSVNGNAPDAQGDVTVAVSAPYLVYTGIITATSTVTVTVLQNTLGNTINWSNPSNGTIRGTLASGNFADTNKVWITSGCYRDSPSFTYFVSSRISGPNRIDLDFVLHDGTQTGTPNAAYYAFEIRVYP